MAAAKCNPTSSVSSSGSHGTAQVSQLRGHKAQITFLQVHPRHDHIILSASQDDTIRYWDLLTGKALRVLVWKSTASTDADSPLPDISSLYIDPQTDDREHVYVSRGTIIALFSVESDDQTSVIQRSPTQILDMAKLFPQAEEINMISRNSQFMAFADDSGYVFCLRHPVFSSSSPTDSDDVKEVNDALTSMTNIHTNVCTGCALLRTDSESFISTGMDCRVVKTRLKSKTPTIFETSIEPQERSLVAVSAAGSSITPSSTGSQALNPPFIHSLALDRTETWAACAVGDGSCAVLDTEEGAEQMRLFGEHANGVVCVAWMDLPADMTDRNETQGLLVTAGTDGRIVIWKVDNALKQTDRQRIVKRLKLSQKMASKKGSRPSRGSAKTQDLVPPQVLYRILHGYADASHDQSQKTGTALNWITVSPACGVCIVACDVNNEITVYRNLEGGIRAKIG